MPHLKWQTKSIAQTNCAKRHRHKTDPMQKNKRKRKGCIILLKWKNICNLSRMYGFTYDLSRMEIDQNGSSSVIVCFVLECGMLNNELWRLLHWGKMNRNRNCHSSQHWQHKKKYFFTIIPTVFFCPNKNGKHGEFFFYYTNGTFFVCLFFIRLFSAPFFFPVASNADYSLIVMLWQTLAAAKNLFKALKPLHPWDCYCLLRYYAQNEAFFRVEAVWVTTIM